MNDSTELVSIVIVNYNGAHLLRNCLDSVLAQHYPRFEVILVDNCSDDDSVRFVKERYTSVRIVQATENLGFAGGNNFGVREAHGALIVLLNNDTVVQPGWLQGLVDAVAPAEVAVASSLVKTEGIPDKYYEKNGALNFSGHNVMRVFERPCNIGYAGGASLIFKKAILQAPFDEEYFAYGEDVYLSLRARFMGYSIVHTNASVVRHLGGATTRQHGTKRLSMLQERNRLLNLLLFFSGTTLLKTVPFIVANLAAKSIASLISGRYSLAAVCRAHAWVVAHPRIILRKRRALRTGFTAKDSDVTTWMTARVTQGETIPGRFANTVAMAYCRIVGLKTIEALPPGTR